MGKNFWNVGALVIKNLGSIICLQNIFTITHAKTQKLGRISVTYLRICVSH